MTAEAAHADQHSGPAAAPALAVEYVLPLRWTDDAQLDELTGYLRRLAAWSDVTVVDGSPAGLYAGHRAVWRGLVRHVPPHTDLRFANGKVNGVLTGLRLARHEHVVIADDDVRYDLAGLRAVTGLLHRADVVRPQNYFDPLPWHARWDTARSLLNRSVAADYPGTLAVRRSTLRGAGGYDGDVLFENLELIRTVRAYGGTEARPLGLYVRRLPPHAGHFLGQRVRQAYDGLAQPLRLAAELSVLPGLAAAAVRRRPGAVAAGVLATVAAAELGRRRAGGTRVFPAGASLLAPVWVLERAVCSWLAVGLRLTRGGVAYSGGRLRTAAHSPRALAARVGPRRPAAGPPAAG